jgi:hypothetical protein
MTEEEKQRIIEAAIANLGNLATLTASKSLLYV